MIRHHQLSRSRILLISTALLCSACSKEEVAPVPEPAAPRNQPVVVHATMPASRILSVLDAYTAETGKEIQLASDDMDASTADLFLAPNIAELWQFAEMDLFRPTVSESIERNIPPALRDPEFRWTALATHARIVVHNTALVSIDELGDVDNYAALGQEKWRNRICLSSSAVPGNRTLIALLIRRYDLREAEIIVRNWRANFATGVFADDLSLIKAISDGKCAIGIAGSNVLAAFVAANAGAPVAAHRFNEAGVTVVDASGGGVTRHAKNPQDAAAVLEWLTTNAPNALYAALGQEFPANVVAPVSLSIESSRDLVAEPVPLSQLGFLHEDAVLLIERARYP